MIATGRAIFFFVAGRRRKLAVSLMNLDKRSDDIMAAVGAHRPDLVR